MAPSEEPINFDIIETQKENIQQIPSGRSARALAAIFSPTSGVTTSSPSPNDTKTLNDAMRQEYENELRLIDEADDPLDIFDRYVKWTMDAYPSAQATPQSGLLPLLERATKAFLSSPEYKNDPRYLRLWLHYIRLFSDAPRETFAYLARHGVGENLALFYEEFAAWLEGACRWAQAEEVYQLGLTKEARPIERLLRKFGEFQHRYEQQPQSADGPSSPALPTVRPALAAKIDPFAASTTPSSGRQTQPRTTGGGGSATRSGKPKLAIFSDADSGSPSQQPAIADTSKGWESIGSIRDRKKENTMEAKPWAGETLKAGKKAPPAQKMTIFKDESRVSESKISRKVVQHVPQHEREAVNPRTGRTERVFVNLEAVYPDPGNPSIEFSFEELRAMNRGWTNKDWGKQKKKPLKETSKSSKEPLKPAKGPLKSSKVPLQPLKDTSGNPQKSKTTVARDKENDLDKSLSAQTGERLVLDKKVKPLDDNTPLREQTHDGKSAKARRKVHEVRNETQTIKTNLDSPTGPKIRKKNTSEPTMTIHTRAATDEIYSIFNQPLKSEIELAEKSDSLCGSDYEDDYTTEDETVGQASATTSEFGDDDTTHFNRHEDEEAEAEDIDANEALSPGEVSVWSDFTASKHIPHLTSNDEGGGDSNASQPDNGPESPSEDRCLENFETPGHASYDDDTDRMSKFFPEPPEDYNPPYGPYRDAAMMAQSRLPFMTPIVEKTEYSMPPCTVLNERHALHSKTPSKGVIEDFGTPPPVPTVANLLISSPLRVFNDQEDQSVHGRCSPSPLRVFNDQESQFRRERCTPSPPKKLKASPEAGDKKRFPSTKPIIKDTCCNPLDHEIKQTILENISPALESYPGYHDHSNEIGGHAAEIRKFIKPPSKMGKRSSTEQSEAPILFFPGAERNYEIKRELGKGAFAPVYLAESIDSVEAYSSDSDSEKNENNKRRRSGDDFQQSDRLSLEAIKMETDPPSAWEFYLLRTAEARLSASSRHARAIESIVAAHEMHLYADEGFLVEDYRNQGTLLDLINAAKAEGGPVGTPEAGLDEVLAVFFAIELFRTTEALHSCGLLHGDLKADNCLVRFDGPSTRKSSALPSPLDYDSNLDDMDPTSIHYSPRGAHDWHKKGLMLIDFGRGVDMKAFQPGVQFIADWEPGSHECHEMREMRPWTYQVDLHGLAGTIHIMLFGKYMESMAVPDANGGLGAGSRKTYQIKDSFKRYWEKGIWNDVFDLCLNSSSDRWVRMERQAAGADENTPLESTVGSPPLNSMRYVREKMEKWLVANAEKKGLRTQLRRLEALVSKKR